MRIGVRGGEIPGGLFPRELIMSRLALALIAYAALGVLSWFTIGDYGDVVIHRFAIQGKTGKQVGLVTLSHVQYIRQFWIQGRILVAPDFSSNNVGFWRYPQGGAPLKRLKVQGGGVTISLAPH